MMVENNERMIEQIKGSSGNKTNLENRYGGSSFIPAYKRNMTPSNGKDHTKYK